MKWYTATSGSFEKMLECVMLSNRSDFPRWKTMLRKAIQKGEAEDLGLPEDVDEEAEDRTDENAKPSKKSKKVAKKSKKSAKGAPSSSSSNLAQALIDAIKSKPRTTSDSEISSILNR